MPLINTRGAASIKGFGFAGFSPTVPGIPTSVSASATSSSSISVSFTAPACNGGLSIDYYQAVCTASGTHSATGSSPISVTGLCGGTSYTFKVRAHNSLGYGCYSSSTGTATTPAAASSLSYTSPGSYTFTAPSGVTSISAVAIAGGKSGGPCARCAYCSCDGQTYYIADVGGGAGGLAYRNNVTVTPGTGYSLQVGTANRSCTGYFSSQSKLTLPGTYNSLCTAPGCGRSGGHGLFCGSASRFGGDGGSNMVSTSSSVYGGGGGGGPGYSGNGGGAGGNAATGGGGGAGNSCYGGGGTGIYGQGSNGAQGSPGSGGSGGNSGSGKNGGSYGAGGAGARYGCTSFGTGANGAVRVIWPGSSRSFPSTCTGSP